MQSIEGHSGPDYAEELPVSPHGLDHKEPAGPLEGAEVVCILFLQCAAVPSDAFILFAFSTFAAV